MGFSVRGSRTSKALQDGWRKPKSVKYLNESSNELRSAIFAYVEMRRALGFKMIETENRLHKFVDFLEAHNLNNVTTKLAVEWAQSPKGSKPGTWAQRLSCVRMFAEFRQLSDPRNEIPPKSILPYRTKRHANPYLYMASEIEQLLCAAATFPAFNSAGILKRQTYYCLFGLLAVSGMRVDSAAMELLQSGANITMIALWLGHESIETTQVYLHASLELKEKLLEKTSMTQEKMERFKPSDRLLEFLKGL